jgi:outer membrane usher protein
VLPERALAWTRLLGAAGRLIAVGFLLLSAGSALAADQEAQLDLLVNGVRRDATRVLIRGDDVLVRVADLAGSGLTGFAGQRERIGDQEWVSLSSLAPELRYALDERELALRITAGPALLEKTVVDLRPSSRPPGLVPRSVPSAFLNYSAQLRRPGDFTGTAELGISSEGALLYGSASLLPGGGAARGLTSLTIDDGPRLRRWVVGEGYTSGGALGGGALVAGLSLAREFGLDPYLIRGPLPRLSGFASTPSTLDLYVNGVLVRELSLAPGIYDLSNLPVAAGSGTVRTVLRDAYGSSQELDWRYYYVSDLLAPGFDDYGYAIGFRRLRYGLGSFDYGAPLLTARHRRGFTPWLTAGGRLEASHTFVSGGPSVTIGLPAGTLEVAAAASGQRGTPGGAASIGYSYTSRGASGAALFRWMSPRYAHAALDAGAERPLLQANFTFGVPILSRLSATASVALERDRDGGRSTNATGRAEVAMGMGLALILSGGRTQSSGAPGAWEAFTTLFWAFGAGTNADLTVQGGDQGNGASIGIQRSLPAGPGVGFRARASTVGDTLDAEAEAQWAYGRYAVEYQRQFGRDVASGSVSGGMVLLGGRAFLTRPVQDGYALLRTGVPGVRGYLEHQEIGRTDRRGDLLVPSLLPYYGNRLSIADSDVPIDYRIEGTERLAAPTLRGGALASFAVQRLRTVSGSIRVITDRGEEIPAYGELTVAGPSGPSASPVGRDGAFYFEDLPAGRFPAQLEWTRGRCRIELQIAEAEHVDVGLVRCRLQEDGPAPPPSAPPAGTPAP